MDPENTTGLSKPFKTVCLDTVIEKGILFLLVFTPFAFGAVHNWSTAVMEIAAFGILIVWLVKQSGATAIIQDKNLILLFVFFVVVVALQIVPIPRVILDTISPKTGDLYNRFGTSEELAASPISLYPWATEQELIKFLAYGAVFVVIINHYKTKERIDSLVTSILYIASFLIVFAFIQKVAWNGRLYWIFPFEAYTESTRSLLVWGPFVNRNHFAGYLELVIPLAIGRVLYFASRGNNPDDQGLQARIRYWLSSSRLWGIILWSIVAFVMTGTLFMTLSRGGIIACVCSLTAFVFFAKIRKGLRKRTGFMGAIALVLFLVLLAGGWERIEARFGQLGDERPIKRAQIMVDSSELICDFPFLGTGFGTFRSIYPMYQSHSSALIFDHAHNDYLQLIVETGMIGSAVCMSILVLFFVKVLKAWFARHRTYVKTMAIAGISSCTAFGVHGLTDFNFHIPANALLVTIIAAITYSLVHNVCNIEIAQSKDKIVLS